MLGYEDVESVYYFGSDYKALWTETYVDINHAMTVAGGEAAAMLVKSETHDAVLEAALVAKAGAKYVLTHGRKWERDEGGDRRKNGIGDDGRGRERKCVWVCVCVCRCLCLCHHLRLSSPPTPPSLVTTCSGLLF